ncbi:MAG: hypothetical protein R3B72_48955 [Polyangiaceae bacterium]
MTAAAGLVAGLVGCGNAKPPADPTDEMPKADDAAGSDAMDAAGDVAGDKDCCKGKNECKGQGNCKTDSNDCAGKNECKGQGGCKPEGCQ